MADIVKTPSRTFIGRAWVNVIKKEDSAMKGQSFINIKLDNGISEVVLRSNDTLQLWPNAKREGSKDADLRLSVVTAPPVAVVA